MKIAINGLFLSQKNTGGSRYLLDVVNGLKIGRGEEYFLYASNDIYRRRIVTNDSVKMRDCGLVHASRPLRLIWENLYFSSALRAEKVDLLHAAAFTLPYNISCRSVITIFDLTFFTMPHVHEKSKVAYFRKMIPPTLNRADKIIAISQQTKNDIIKLFNIADEKVEIIHIGVGMRFKPVARDDGFNRMRKKHGLPESYILFVGTIEPRKNLCNLIRAYSEMQKRGFPHSLVIVGKRGWGYKEIFNVIRKLKVKSIIFTDFVDDADMPFIYNGADVFVYPSFYEGFGIPVVEAMACGVPVVTSNVSSMAEIAEGAAALVDPYQAEQISAAIERILEDKAYARTLVAQGLSRAAMFSQEKMVSMTQGVYHKVLGDQN